MRKYSVLAMVLIFVFCFSTIAMAGIERPENPRNEYKVTPIFIDADGKEIVSYAPVVVGSTVKLITWTQKEGSSYEDSWIVRINGVNTWLDKTTIKVTVDGEEFYKSTAIFKASDIGTYRLIYAIDMWNSRDTWEGTAYKQVTFTSSILSKDDGEKGYPGPSDNARIKSNGKAGGNGKYGNLQPGWYN